VCLFSASYAVGYHDHGGNSMYFVMRQMIFASIGLIAMYAASRMDYHRWVILALPVFLLSVVLLASIKIVPSIWVTINDATRWIGVGDTLTFQPSEIAKFGVIVLFSAAATILGPKKMKKFHIGILPFMAAIGLIALLLSLEPHISATVIIAGIGIVIIFLGGASFWWLLGIGAAGAAGAVALIIYKADYALVRLKVWFDPFSDMQGRGWQGSQAQIAVGSGGFWGLGLGQSRQKHLYLPEPANDFIFAVMCEEFGFLITSMIVIVFALLIWRGYYIASHAGDRFGTLLAAGITTQIAVQVIINLFVVTGIFPVTGASLPFFSYGGTSLVMLLGEVGVLLSVSRSMPPSKGE
jgi:cell division protein FtsW